MKKAILVWAAIMTVGMLALAGCGQKETGQAGEYTNLADKESRKAVVGELEACGVTKEQTATLEKWAEDYQEITAKSYSYPKGFTALPKDGMDYSSILMDDSAKPYSYLQVNIPVRQHRKSGRRETVCPGLRKPLMRVYSRNVLSKP